jgi:predicted nucleic acid-binding protein
MSGKRYVLDTNAIVALLQGNSQITQLLQDANWVGFQSLAKLSFWHFLD